MRREGSREHPVAGPGRPGLFPRPDRGPARRPPRRAEGDCCSLRVRQHRQDAPAQCRRTAGGRQRLRRRPAGGVLGRRAVAGGLLLDLAGNLLSACEPALSELGRSLTSRVRAISGDAHHRRRVLVLDLADLLVTADPGTPVLIILEELPGLGYRLVLPRAGAAVALTAGFAGVTFVRRGPTTGSLISPASGSSASPSSAASLTSTSGPLRSPGQRQWPSPGTPQGAGRRAGR